MFETISDFSAGLLLEVPSTCAGAGAQLVLVNQFLSRLPFRSPVFKHSWLLTLSSPWVTVGGFWGSRGALEVQQNDLSPELLSFLFVLRNKLQYDASPSSLTWLKCQ